MQQHLFEYAVIRIVPRVEREEFINVGIILFCKKDAFLKTNYILDEKRLYALFPFTDIAEITCHLNAFENIARGEKSGGPIALLDTPSRFRWLTAKRSTIVQTSAVHPGFTNNLDVTAKKLLQQLVLIE